MEYRNAVLEKKEEGSADCSLLPAVKGVETGK